MLRFPFHAGWFRGIGVARAYSDSCRPSRTLALKLGADELARTAEVPAQQICTDDFEGPWPNKTNLGAKGILAIEAFAESCRTMGASIGTGGEHHSVTAAKYARTWQEQAFTSAPLPLYKLSNNELPYIPDSWSLNTT